MVEVLGCVASDYGTQMGTQFTVQAELQDRLNLLWLQSCGDHVASKLQTPDRSVQLPTWMAPHHECIHPVTDIHLMSTPDKVPCMYKQGRGRCDNEQVSTFKEND